jgi:hypothetical protein
MSKDDTAVNTQVDADTTPTESAPVKETSEVVGEVDTTEIEDSFDELGGFDEEEDDEAEKEDEEKEQPPKKPVEEKKPEDQPLSGAEKRNQQLDSEIASEKERLGIDPSVEIRNKVELRNALRELKQVEIREAQIANEQELLGQVNPETGEYYTVAEAERAARQQALATQQESVANEKYELQVQQNQQTILSEVQRALTDFPMFDAESPKYNPALAARADAMLGANLIKEESGRYIGSNISPYELYKLIDDSVREATARGEAEGQKATQQMLANADVPGNAPQTPKPKDPDEAAFDEEAARY